MTRWHSFSDALAWLDEHRETQSKLCKVMYDGKKADTKVRDLYGQVGKWLDESPKLTADCEFCFCFCKAVWNPRYHRLVSVDEDTKTASFRAPEIARSFYDFEKKLRRGWRQNDKFASFRSKLDALGLRSTEGDRRTLRGQVVAQADSFFKEALKLNEKHGNRWMRDLLFTGLADDPKVAVPLAKVLLAGLTKAREGTAVPDAQVPY